MIRTMMNMTPTRYQTLILFFLAISTGMVRCQLKYDCRRLDDCQHGGTCTAQGSCTCVDPYDGYNCEYDTSIPCASDPGPCKNGAKCYTIGGNDICACPFGFYGTNCEEESVFIKCDGGTAEFSLAFRTEFSGDVKLNGTAIPSECSMTETTIQVTDNPDMKKYTLKVDLTQNDTGTPLCKLANIVKTTDDQTQAVRYTGLFRVSYIVNVTTSLDELYNLTCSHENSNITVSKGFTGVDVVSENLTVIGFNKTYSPVVELSVLDKDDKVLNSSTNLFVGDIFQLHIYLTDTSAYSAVRIESCTTNNTKTDAEAKLFKVLDQGCPTKLGKRLTTGQINATFTLGTAILPGKKLRIEAFKFVDSNDIGIVCTAKVCHAGDATCDVPDCDTIMNPPGKRRKKRAADDGEPTVSTVIRVLGPNEVSASSNKSTGAAQTVEGCLAKSEVTATIAVLGAVVLVLLIACSILISRLLTRQQKATYVEHVAHNKTDRFHIPRAHVNESFTEM